MVGICDFQDIDVLFRHTPQEVAEDKIEDLKYAEIEVERVVELTLFMVMSWKCLIDSNFITFY